MRHLIALYSITEEDVTAMNTTIY